VLSSLVDDVPTPAVLVDLDVLERNIARMAARAQEARVRLRPHAKTHKCPEIARLQRAAGALGLSLAKVGEAEVFVAAGFDDIFLAYPTIGEDKALRLLRLSDNARLAVGVDSIFGATSLARAFAAAGRSLDVLIKVDVGFGRVGVPPERLSELAARIAGLRGLRLRGLFTHAGHAYAASTRSDVAAIARQEGETLVAAAQVLRGAGLDEPEVSAGSTPTAAAVMGVAGITECRPGNYVFHDASQVALGTCTLEDCALTVMATVVSVQAPGRAVVDAGSKTLSSDPLRPTPGGYGQLLGSRSRITTLSEEHGLVAVAEGESFRVGERVRILPNHACVVANLHDRLLGTSGGRVEAVLDVSARGRVR
jgi:D-serine deaminase-like pyridoxal phosphate-dependent protein